MACLSRSTKDTMFLRVLVLQAVESSGRTSQRSTYHVWSTRASILGLTCASTTSIPWRASYSSVFSEQRTASKKTNGDLYTCDNLLLRCRHALQQLIGAFIDRKRVV